ncbi:unnamed protein product [Cylindrotheca closterium]|uniref:HSF-type DNA-binding domain-containing protein n=1 Tax=Cylindrotheca closterium TaxID=2856 RepID=A0AAD2CFL1_9STRA|nr:unnamed protein product [Cylindrotheca closterium]
MTAQTISKPLSQSITPLMALADAALNDGEESAASSSSSLSTCSLSEEKQDSAETKLMTTPPMDKLSFAQQLMTLLDDESSPYLKWMPDGKSFTIKNPKKFTSDQMPKLFHIRNMSSFVRKLTRWGFTRHHEKETMNSDIFKHACFQKGEWDRCAQIKCATRQPVSLTTIRKDFQRTPTASRPVSIPPSAPRPVSPVMSKPTTTAPAQSQQSPQNFQEWKPLSAMQHHPAIAMPRRSAFCAVTPMVAELDLMKKLHPTTRANLLTLQLLREASQTQQQLTDQALLRIRWHLFQQMAS